LIRILHAALALFLGVVGSLQVGLANLLLVSFAGHTIFDTGGFLNLLKFRPRFVFLLGIALLEEGVFLSYVRIHVRQFPLGRV